MENFRFLALQYLNDWVRYDRDLVSGLRRESRDDRLDSLQKAAKYYKIARNFKKRPDERKRLDNALQELEAVSDPIIDESVDSVVCNLAETFAKTYGKHAISAASKFLWIRYQSPVVIYDGRAQQCLNKQCGGRLREGDYANYRRQWAKQLAMCEDRIRSVCAELVRVKDFSLAYDLTDEEFGRLVGSRWFHERVFDTFLWWNGGDKAVPSVEVQTLP